MFTFIICVADTDSLDLPMTSETVYFIFLKKRMENVQKRKCEVPNGIKSNIASRMTSKNAYIIMNSN